MLGTREHGRRGAATVVLALVGVLALVSAPAGAQTTARTTGNTWHVAATLGLGTEDTAVACPISSVCWALEAGVLLSSHDGGSTWTDETAILPTDVAALNDMDCTKMSACYVTATLDDGAPGVVAIHSGAPTVFDGPGANPLPTISCPSARHCVATDGTTVYITHDGAAHWSTYTLPTIVHSNAALDCVVRSARCWIVGDNGETPVILSSADGGRHWQSQSAPATTDGMYDVACPTTSTCYAVGADFSDNAVVIGTHDRGVTWTIENTPAQAYPLRSVSCASETTCWAAGLSPARSPYVFATTSSGDQWNAQALPSSTSGGSPYLSCPSILTCSAVTGGLTFATTDGGNTWTDTQVPAAVATPQALSCPSATACVGVSNDALGRPAALTSHDGGTSWARHDMPAVAANLLDVDCPSVSTCFALSSGTAKKPTALVSHALSSTDGGATWRVDTATFNRAVLGHLTCPSATTCLAAGYGGSAAVVIEVTTDGGSTWQPVTPPSGAFYLDGISCASVTSCVVITQGTTGPPTAWTTADLGASYQPHTLPDSDFFDVGCAGTTCVAVGADGGDGAIATSGDGGVTWVAATVPREAQILGDVACGSATACAATAFDFSQDGGPLIVGTTNAGRTWTAFAVPARNEEPIDVACSGASCVASDVSLSGNPLVLAGKA